MRIVPLIWSLCSLSLVDASITVYNQLPLGQMSLSAAASAYTAPASYDPTILNPPAIPANLPKQITVQPQSSIANVPGAPINVAGSFLGFSIEFSVINQAMGINASVIQVPFLNLMSNIAERGGEVHIRVGGNSQDYATMVDSLPNNAMIAKDTENTSGVTQTPPLLFTPEVLYLLSNITKLVDTRWYLGIPLNDSTNLRLTIADAADQILGDNLLGFQVGNEPDLYVNHGHRLAGYGPADYYKEFGDVINGLKADTKIDSTKNLKLIGPNIQVLWTPQQVWDTGFIDSYKDNLYALAVEHYPSDNCAAMYNTGTPRNPQDVFPQYLSHGSIQNLAAPYVASTALAIQAGRPFIMFETNTASCGGFPGVSQSFGAAMWGIDYGLTMAAHNFSGMLFHVGGQGVYYNPFTPPPTNQSTFRQWTVGPVYYSAMIVSEILGKSGATQVVDLGIQGDVTPAFGVYESGTLTKVALFNFVTDQTGASAYDAVISVAGGNAPSSVQVKYFLSSSVAAKNMTWANQTFGGPFETDGRMAGDIDVQTVNCDQTAKTCTIHVPAPAFALVHLNNDAFGAQNKPEIKTYATTAYTKTHRTATVDPAVLQTSNGHRESDRRLGSTSNSLIKNAGTRLGFEAGVVTMVLALLMGAFMMRRV